MGEGAEKGVGQQAGNLNLRQSDGCDVSCLKQRDVLKKKEGHNHGGCRHAPVALGALRTFITY